MYEKNGIAIFTPENYEKLRDKMRIKHRVLSDFLLMTGMRYVEAKKVKKQWYNKNAKKIHLPREADAKPKRTTPDRYVHLSTAGKRAVDRYFEEEYKFPTYIAFDQILKRIGKQTGFLEKGKTISVKSFRKTWESWLVAIYPERQATIALNQGHTSTTAMIHYLNIGFSAEERKQISEQVSGWMD